MRTDAADVLDIEEAFVALWSLFGRWPGARLVDEDGALCFETPLRKLPCNGVIRTAIDERPDQVILFLGLLHEDEGIAARALDPFGITRERARGEVEQLVGRGGSTLPGKIPFTDRAKSVLGLS